MSKIDVELRALIACDEPVTAREVEQAFLDNGIEVLRVKNGRDALDSLRSMELPQFAIFDAMMPGMDGAALTERIRGDERFKSLFIVLLTQESDGNAWRRARKVGADDALSKPVLADELALRLDLWKRFHVLKRIADSGASHDQVTGLYSHGLILEIAQHELDRAAREEMPLSVLLTDVDHLRHINESYGHQMGDKVLAEVARRVQVALRSYDLSGRYGGEEFLTVLPRCGRANAIEVGERVRRAVQAEAFEIDRLKMDVTVSVGVATTMGD
ncbi:MAG TPA: diguanylate cyclase, partial [Gammaproteobacteria bacterium]